MCLSQRSDCNCWMPLCELELVRRVSPTHDTGARMQRVVGIRPKLKAWDG